MPQITTRTELQVLAGDIFHVGTLSVSTVTVQMNPVRMIGEPEPKYDYASDAGAIVAFLYRFLPRETYEAVVEILKSTNPTR